MLLVTELLTVESVVDVTEHTEHNLAMAKSLKSWQLEKCLELCQPEGTALFPESFPKEVPDESSFNCN